jgi:multiple sugar transport system ATP-binding protein
MRDGRVQQLDTPQALYRSPVNLFVASFIGSPAMNLVEARVDEDGVAFGGFRLPVDREARTARNGGTVILGIRPEDFSIAGSKTRLPTIEAEVVVVEDLGADTHVVFALDAPRFAGASGTSGGQDEDQLLTDTRAHFTARIATHTQMSPGQRIQLDVDPARFHFFDPDSGNRINA